MTEPSNLIQTLAASIRRLADARDELSTSRHSMTRPVAELLRRVSSQVEQAMEQLVNGQRELDMAMVDMAALQQRELELLEGLGPCVLTDSGGVILQANTSALLLLRASAAALGRHRLQEFAPDAAKVLASLHGTRGGMVAPLGISGSETATSVQTVVTRVEGEVPCWRWLFHRSLASPSRLESAAGSTVGGRRSAVHSDR